MFFNKRVFLICITYIFNRPMWICFSYVKPCVNSCKLYKQCSFCLQCYIFLYIVYQYIAILGPYIYCNILKHFPYGNVLFNIQYILHVFLFKYSASARTVQGLSVKYSQVFVEMGGGGMSMRRFSDKVLDWSHSSRELCNGRQGSEYS